MKAFKLRETFWSPYEQVKEHIGKKFEVIAVVPAGELDVETEGQLFTIKLEDGEVITAWAEEIYTLPCGESLVD